MVPMSESRRPDPPCDPPYNSCFLFLFITCILPILYRQSCEIFLEEIRFFFHTPGLREGGRNGPPLPTHQPLFLFFPFSEDALHGLLQVLQGGLRPCPEILPRLPAGFFHHRQLLSRRFLLNTQLLYLLLPLRPGPRRKFVRLSAERFDLLAPHIQLLLHLPEHPLPR